MEHRPEIPPQRDQTTPREISIVIPAYNEEKRVMNVLRSMENAFEDNCEIIVVCNGCIDNTSQVVEDIGREYSNIKCMEFEEKLGKGGAILEGLKAAEGKYIGFLDADDAFESASIKKMIDVLDNDGVGCVIASKWIGKKFSEVTEDAPRKVLSRGWNALVCRLFGMPFKDTQAGAKFLKKEVFDSIDKNFICRGFEFDVELLWKIQKSKSRVEELYILSKAREGSTFSIKYIPSMFINLVKLRRRRD